MGGDRGYVDEGLAGVRARGRIGMMGGGTEMGVEGVGGWKWGVR